MTAPLDADGPAAPPRRNGELIFEEPWESRAFGMAVSLYEADLFAWERFQRALVVRIGRWQATATDTSRWSYYEHWLGALTDVLSTGGHVADTEIAQRAGRLAQRPLGHDHAH